MAQPTELLSGDLEIRMLPVQVSQNLFRFFEGDDSILSLMMGNITTDLENPNSTFRFTSSDETSIRDHAPVLMKSPVLILIDEWSTMGKERPRLRHLLALLIKCQLFRAADYLAQLLGQSEPNRPVDGPAAFVDIELPDAAENMVNGIVNPFDVNLDNHVSNRRPNSPNINFASRTNNVTVSAIRPSLPLIGSFPLIPTTSNPRIKPVEAQSSQSFLPALSILQNSDRIPFTVNPEQIASLSENLPVISSLMLNGDSHSQTDELPAVLGSFEARSNQNDSFANIPQISQIFSNGGEKSSQSLSRTRSFSTSSSDSDE